MKTPLMQNRRGVSLIEATIWASVFAFASSFVAGLITKPVWINYRISQADAQRDAVQGLDIVMDDLKGATVQNLWPSLYPNTSSCGMANVCNASTHPLCQGGPCNGDNVQGIPWFVKYHYTGDVAQATYIMYYFSRPA